MLLSQISLRTLQIRIGKCEIKSQTEQSYAVQFHINEKRSALSQLRKIKNNQLQFNNTLRISLQKQYIQNNDIELKGQVKLYQIDQNRNKNQYAYAIIDIIKDNNQGFIFYDIFTYESNQKCGRIQLSLMFGEVYSLGTKSQIIFTGSNSFDNYDHMAKSRGLQSINGDDYIQQDNKQHQIKSQIDQQHQHMQIPVLSPVIHKKKNTRNRILSIKRPQNKQELSKDQIIQKYQSTIKQLQKSLIQKQQWGNNIKNLVQQLQAQNQLLKQLKIQQLAEQQINNLQQGIQEISKMVHSKFQASRSNHGESRLSYNQKIQQIKQFQSNNQQKQQAENNQKQLKSTKSLRNIPKYEQDQQKNNQNNDKNSLKQQKMIPVTNEQDCAQLQDCINIISGISDHKIISGNFSQHLTKISELQQQVFRQKQQKQQLQQVAQHMYSQLSKMKQDRVDLIEQIHILKNQRVQIQRYIETIKQQNKRLKDQNLQYNKLSDHNYVNQIKQENISLNQRLKEYQRQLKQSVKAIEQFRNDSMKAKDQLIMKQEQLLIYKNKYANINMSNDNNLESNKTFYSIQNIVGTNQTIHSNTQNKQLQQTTQNQNNINTNNTQNIQNLSTIYSNLLQKSLSSRKQLQSILLQTINPQKILNNNKNIISSDKQFKLRRIQNKINKMFIQIIKNKNILKNINQIEMAKRQITTQIQQLLN